jgi:DNA-binding MarR family transcriptional regulator
MEIFLMAAVSRARLNTLYALQQAASLQPGSLSHVIKVLEEARLLVRSEGAERGRRAMTLTETGERFLAEEWRTSLDANREMESILRSVTVALLMDDSSAALSFLHQAAFERERRQGPHRFRTFSRESTPIDMQAEVRAVYESRRCEMEARVLNEFQLNLVDVFRGRETT